MKRNGRAQRLNADGNQPAARRHSSLRAEADEADGIPGARVGVVEYFRLGDREAVENVLSDLRALGVVDLRTHISWADWETPEGEAWYTWLVPRLARDVNVVPCVLYTPLNHSAAPKVSAPPWDPKAYGDFIDILITRLGNCFDWIEFWDEPDRLSEWDRTLDPFWQTFCAMIGGAAYWAQRRGKRTLLGGSSIFDPNWIELMFRRGVMQYIDAVGIHGFPGNSETTWEGWPVLIQSVQQSLNHHRSGAEVWITSSGYSTWRHDEYEQLRAFANVIEAPVERIYWYSARDLDPDFSTRDGFHNDDRDYHFGLVRSEGTPTARAALVRRRARCRARRAQAAAGCPPPDRQAFAPGCDYRWCRFYRHQFSAPAAERRRACSGFRQRVPPRRRKKFALALGNSRQSAATRVRRCPQSLCDPARGPQRESCISFRGPGCGDHQSGEPATRL